MQRFPVKLAGALIAFWCLNFVAEAAGPETVSVTKKPFGVIVDFAGVVFPTKAMDVVLWPKGIQNATVESVVPHGTRVAKGDALLVFDTRSLMNSIKKQEVAVRQAELALGQVQDALAHFQKTRAIRLKAAEKELQVATEDLKRFNEDLGPSQQRVAKYQMKSLKEQLLYAEEELKQLEKMYKEDKVTEESEEIVLTRQRNFVERVRFIVKETSIGVDQTLRYTIPRTKKSLETQLETATVALAKLKADLPGELKSKQIAVEQQQLSLKGAQDQLAEQKYNLGVLSVKAPTDGIVYYGHFHDGKWSVEEARRTLCKGGTIRGGAVVMSVVSPAEIVVEASVNEVQAQFLKAGQKALVMPTSLFGARLTGKVLNVSDRPTVPGKHTASVAVDLPEDKSLPVYAGAECHIRVVSYRNDNALVLARKLVHEDKLNNSQHYVWFLPKDAKAAVRKDVTVGYVSGEEIEITSGLNVGDRILKEVPKEK